MSDAWYPPADAYWAPPDRAADMPYRYGDLIAAPEGCIDSKGRPWTAAMLLSPSCTLVSKASAESLVLVSRVRPISAMSAQQRSAVRAGWQERDGQIYVAHAATFWMPPAPGGEADLFARFDDVANVRYDTIENRLAALDHDARVHLIRREIYYKYRWVVAIDHVRSLESERIAGDPAFQGPRPTWGISRT